MPVEFIKYRDFFESETAAEFVVVLRNHGIDYEIEEFDDSLGAPYGERPLSFVTTVKIRKEDFYKVDKVLIDEANEYIEDIGKDHYLYTFTNEELFEVISKPDEWSAIDYQLAKTVLRQRGVMVDDVTFDKLKKDRLAILSMHKPGASLWAQLGFLIVLAGGIIGLFLAVYFKLFEEN